jgi:hypothetical protein
MRVRLLLIGVLTLVLAISACGGTSAPSLPSPVEASPLPAVQRAQVDDYFATNSYDVPKGWSRGVLTSSVKQPSACNLGTCWTWHGTAIRPDGSVASLESKFGDSDVYGLLGIGDDFLWKGGPSNGDDVKILKYGVVSTEE